MDCMKKSTCLFATALTMASTPLAIPPCAEAADIYGTVTLKGTPPPEIDIVPLKNDPACGLLHKKMPTTHFYVVGPGGGLGGVVVALEGFRGKSTGSTASPLVLDRRA